MKNACWKWQANIASTAVQSANHRGCSPVDQITGSLKANGYAKPNQQIIQLNNIDLLGRLAQQMKRSFNHKAYCCAWFRDREPRWRLDFAVNYDGASQSKPSCRK